MSALSAEEVWPTLKRGGSAKLADDGKAKFSVGDSVTAKVFNHAGHIRLPEYVQGHRGRIASDHGMFIFPDLHATGIKQSQRLYSVRFEAADIWADETRRGAVYVDLFESYLVEE